MMDNPVPIQPGTELRVDRGLYHHHGLYIGNGAVVQFGGQIKDKPHASIHYASVADFAKGARIRAVEHEKQNRADAIRRAVWLLENPPPASYHLFGYNCEHVARWCATGNVESSQATNALTANSFMSVGVFAFLGHPHGWLVGLLQLILGLFAAWLARGSTRKFEHYVAANWHG